MREAMVISLVAALCSASLLHVVSASSESREGDASVGDRFPLLLQNASGSVSTEAEALLVLEAIGRAEFQAIPFLEVEKLVHLGWWTAAKAAVRRAHEFRQDLTAPVRRATAQAKKDADELVKWCDRDFAIPKAAPMAAKWSQNASAVLVAARFSEKWSMPGAQLAAFSSAKGQAHIDKARTAERVQELLSVNISATQITAEITAEAGSARKRFVLNASLFCEIVPEGSSWDVVFHRAQGSMQMSSGSVIPELQLYLQKRLPGSLRWPRLALDAAAAVLPTWPEAPTGLSVEQNSPGDEAVRQASPVICGARAGAGVYCFSSDACVTSCDPADCSGAAGLHSSKRRCIQPLLREDGSSWQVRFDDDDFQRGLIGGVLQWNHTPGDASDGAEAFHIHFGRSATDVPEAESSLLITAPAYGATIPAVHIPFGTPLPEGVSHLLIVGENEVGKTHLASVELHDRFRPPPLLQMRFRDQDNRFHIVRGYAELEPPSMKDSIAAYELHFVRYGGDGKVELLHSSVSLLARETRSVLEAEAARRIAGDPQALEDAVTDVPFVNGVRAPLAPSDGYWKRWIRLHVLAAVKMPNDAQAIAAFSLTADGVMSEPLVLGVKEVDFTPAPPPKAAKKQKQSTPK
eukprot:TRINITY_DN81722_c0_g1_i1.p1 TRINITY_DN81722_c0_g1~~TRINITY_DN81722_c0_g1_i1.p1  ORF type:complete len:633 (-),score=113.53 TRINITY_DN81722_c0_g1_i1:83-1981(-)